MLPDLTVITPETVEFPLLFSLENKIPILTFSDKYVESGAFMSVNIDPFDIGRQAGEMAAAVSRSRGIKQARRVEARKGTISINMTVARKLGIDIDEEIIKDARVIGEKE